MALADQISMEPHDTSRSPDGENSDRDPVDAAERHRSVCCGEYRIECQDNLQFMRGLDDEQMKLVVTSPPYNLGKTKERRTSIYDYLRSQEEVIRECVRILHPEGSICWQVG